MDRLKDTAGEIFLVSFLDFIAHENISSTSFNKQRESETAFKDPSEAKFSKRWRTSGLAMLRMTALGQDDHAAPPMIPFFLSHYSSSNDNGNFSPGLSTS